MSGDIKSGDLMDGPLGSRFMMIVPTQYGEDQAFPTGVCSASGHGGEPVRAWHVQRLDRKSDRTVMCAHGLAPADMGDEVRAHHCNQVMLNKLVSDVESERRRAADISRFEAEIAEAIEKDGPKAAKRLIKMGYRKQSWVSLPVTLLTGEEGRAISSRAWGMQE